MSKLYKTPNYLFCEMATLNIGTKCTVNSHRGKHAFIHRFIPLDKCITVQN